MFKYWRFKRFMKKQKKYNASLQAWLLVKGDHINDRLERYAHSVRLHNNLISRDDFLKFVKDMQVMISSELTYQKYEDEEEKEKC